MTVNLENLKKNIIREVNQNITTNKIALKTLIPSIFGCVVLDGLATMAVRKAPETVIAVTEQVLGISKYLLLVAGCLAFYKGLDDYYAHIDPKRIKYVKIPEKDFEAMQAEIIRLRHELEKKDV